MQQQIWKSSMSCYELLLRRWLGWPERDRSLYMFIQMICFALSSCKGFGSALQLPSYAEAVASLSRNDCDFLHLPFGDV